MNKAVKILHLEDMPTDAELIKRYLLKSDIHAEIRLADNKKQFLDALVSWQPDLVLSDHSLPAYDSWKALEDLKATAAGTPFILVTGTMPEGYEYKIVQAGASGYVLKDNIERLPSLVLHTLKNQMMKDERQKYEDKNMANEVLMKEAEALAHLGSWTYNFETNQSEWSDEAYRMWGYEPGEITPSYETFLTGIHPDDLDFVKTMTSPEMLSRNSLIKFEFRLIGKTGKLKYIKNELVVKRNEADMPVRLYGFNLDITETRETELSLKKKENFYKAIIEKSADMKVLIDKNGTVVFGSPAITKILTYSLTEFAGKNFSEYIHYRDRKKIKFFARSVLKNPGSSVTMQVRVLHKSGSYRWCEGTVTNLLHDPDINAYIINFRDITERKVNETKLAQSQKRYKELFDNSPVPSWVFDVHSFEFLYVNKAALRHYGYTEEEIYKVSVLDIRPSDYIDYLRKAILQPGLHRTRHLKKDGTVIDVELNADAIIYEGREARIVQINDITEKLKAEEETKKLQANLEAILNNTQSAYVLFDKFFNVITVNALAQKKAKEHLGKLLHPGIDIFSFLQPAKLAELKPALEKVLAGENLKFETEVHSLTYGNIWFDVTFSAVRNTNQMIIGILMAAEDITLRKKSEEKLLQSQAHLLASQRIGHIGSWEMDITIDGEGIADIRAGYASDETNQLLGYTSDYVTDPSFMIFEAIHPDDVENVRTGLTKAAFGNGVYENEIRVKNAEGIYRTIHTRGEIVDSKAADNLKMIGTLQDVTEIRKAEAALVQSEASLKATFNNTSTGYILADTNMNVLTVNVIVKNWVAQMLGHNIQEGMNLTHIMKEDTIWRINAVMDQVKAGEKISYEAKYAFDKQDDIWLSVSFSPVPDETGKIIAVVIAADDITYRKASEEKLKQSQAHLLASQRIGRVGSWEADFEDAENLQWAHVYWSDEIYRIFGYEQDKIEPAVQHYFSRIYPDDISIVENMLREVMQTGKRYSTEHRILTPEGQLKTVHNIIESFFNPETGKLVKLSGTMQDVTEYKKNVEALQKSEANLRTIFNNAGASYLLLDTECRIVSFNEITRQVWRNEINAEPVEGTDVSAYFPENYVDRILNDCRRVLAGENIEEENSVTGLDGKENWYLKTMSPVKNSDGKILGLLIARTNITERKISELEREKMTADLVQRNSDLEQFAYIVSHNLRGPVANILGSAELLQMEDIDEDDRRFMTEGLHASVNKLDQVITDLNNILQLKRQVNENKETVSFSKLVHDIEVAIAQTIEKEHAVIITDFKESDTISTIKSYLYSIFYNLIFNSLKYRKTSEPPVIRISSFDQNDSVKLVFKDNGIGINMEKLKDQVFGLYKRFHLHTEGKGMGLFMVKTQVETLGGSITLESAENEGCEFTIVLKK